MSRYNPTEEEQKYIDRIVDDLSELGIYRPELDQTIYSLAMSRMMYDKLHEDWADEGFQMVSLKTNKGGHSYYDKSPYLNSHLQLEGEILRREKELGLTVVSMKRVGNLERTEDDKLDQLLGE